MAKELVGKVAHYFGKISVAALKLSGPLKVGDRISVETNDGTAVLEQGIQSMQVNHQNVESASAGDDVAIKTEGRVHSGNLVYRVTE